MEWHLIHLQCLKGEWHSESSECEGSHEGVGICILSLVRYVVGASVFVHPAHPLIQASSRSGSWAPVVEGCIVSLLNFSWYYTKRHSFSVTCPLFGLT